MSSVLLLVPTELEREKLSTALSRECRERVAVELCGFGPIVSAIQATLWIERLQPQHVCLLGIAGSLSDRAVVGQAYMFRQVACYGIGAGCGDGFQTASALGWAQWQDPLVGDLLESHAIEKSAIDGCLVTTCSASASANEAAQKRRVFPGAVAEDMEAFSVAAACRIAGIPFSCIRGISNRAGDREKSNWQIDKALTSASGVFLSVQQQLLSL